MFNILGTLSSNSAEAFQLGRAEPPHVNRLALFHTVFAPLTVRLSKGREGFGDIRGSRMCEDGREPGGDF